MFASREPRARCCLEVSAGACLRRLRDVSHEVNRKGLRPYRTHCNTQCRRPDGSRTHPAYAFISTSHHHMDPHTREHSTGPARSRHERRGIESRVDAQAHHCSCTASWTLEKRHQLASCSVGASVAPAPPKNGAAARTQGSQGRQGQVNTKEGKERWDAPHVARG